MQCHRALLTLSANWKSVRMFSGEGAVTHMYYTSPKPLVLTGLQEAYTSHLEHKLEERPQVLRRGCRHKDVGVAQTQRSSDG